MNRPKNTAHTPQRVNNCLARATCPGPKCFGKRFPSRSNSDIPYRRPMVYPIESPTIAPMMAATPTQTGLMSRFSREDSSAALTSAISPGRGIPRLSSPMTSPTVRYTASAGMDSRNGSIVTGSGCPIAVATSTLPGQVSTRLRR